MCPLSVMGAGYGIRLGDSGDVDCKHKRSCGGQTQTHLAARLFPYGIGSKLTQTHDASRRPARHAARCALPPPLPTPLMPTPPAPLLPCIPPHCPAHSSVSISSITRSRHAPPPLLPSAPADGDGHSGQPVARGGAQVGARGQAQQHRTHQGWDRARRGRQAGQGRARSAECGGAGGRGSGTGAIRVNAGGAGKRGDRGRQGRHPSDTLSDALSGTLTADG